MKRILTLILLSLFCTAVYAQNKNSILEKERAFIMSYLNKYGNWFIGQPFILYDKPIYYADALREAASGAIEKALINDTISGYRIEKDSFMWEVKQLDYAISGTVENKDPLLIFTPAEKLHIREQVKKMCGEAKLWKEKDFGINSIMLDLDTLRTFNWTARSGLAGLSQEIFIREFHFFKTHFFKERYNLRILLCLCELYFMCQRRTECF